MPDRNEIIGNLGLPQKRPLDIDPPSPEIIQGSITSRLVSDALKKAINYETLPLICENFLATIVMDLFEQDPIFTYIPGDEAKSQIRITTNWSRSAIKHHAAGPLVVVAFQGASADEDVLGNLINAKSPGKPRMDTRGLVDSATFRITIMHRNRTIALFLAQQIRSAIAGSMEMIKQVFKVQKVYPPSLSGPGEFEELEDYFGAYVDLRLITLPNWKQTSRPEYITKIVLATVANAGRAVQDGLEQGVDVP